MAAARQPAADEQPGPHLREHRSSCRCRRRAPATTRRPPTCRPTTWSPARYRGCSTASRIPGEFGYDTWPEARTRNRRRPQLERVTVDEQSGIAFIPFGTARFDFYGGDPPGQQPVRQLAGRARRAHRQAALALPARASRSVGLRPAAGAEAADDPAERPQHRRRRAGDQARLPVRVRARDRTTDLADRGAPGAAVRRPRRDDVADAAVPDQAGAVRAAVVHRKRHQPVSAAPRREGARRALRSTCATRGCSRRRASRARSQLPGHNGGANLGTSAVDPTRGEIYVVAKNMPT